MKSGCGFHESCNDIYVKAYRMEIARCKDRRGGAPKYTAEEIEEMHPPHHRDEYTKSPWHFGLLIKKFRRDPQLALHIASSVMSDPDNASVSRTELTRQKQLMLREKKNNANSKESTRGPPRSINIANNARASSSLPSSSASGRQSAAANVSAGSGRSQFADSADEEEKRVLNNARILISTTHANQHLLNRRMGS